MNTKNELGLEMCECVFVCPLLEISSKKFQNATQSKFSSMCEIFAS
jgi:hypothetical protein